MSVKLACPNCGSTDELGTVEDLSGTAECSAIYREDDGSIMPEHSGSTEIHWDSSTSTGAVACGACYWEGPEQDLVPENDTEEVEA